MKIITLDGTFGEGGGQILRSALTLSMITGQPFRLERIRARRSRPGLRRQHLTAVEAAAEISSAHVDGAAPGSSDLLFAPGPLRGGDHRFAIGTAGSCTLVLQTILPALWTADRASTVIVSGGTHNPGAPPADFLIRAWLPVVRSMGIELDLDLVRHGFFPAGGGELRARVTPGRPKAIELIERGACRGRRLRAIVAGIPEHVAQRELAQFARRVEGFAGEVCVLPEDQGPGNVLLAEVEHERVSEVFTGFGARGLPAEKVADRVAANARAYLDSPAAVAEHLADQILLPMALAGSGRFTTVEPSSHLLTNLAVIRSFLEIDARVEPGRGRWTVHVGRSRG